ncbi:hypothetical protein [Actinomadura sp. NEAU-AAG7]|uniref:hypothetical protein n=1 Tax=Actinomadura sp. NEAU-AAG7 TaxID=2839640 RepID=UPI001BE43353|nr:hypothetical protein [Actinomadura sp. NEAU-AAG7]MBT2210530.1 hypothetical protein [Actinomadura sp. NEAU-AAG7]
MSIDDVYALMTRSEELPYGEARTVLVEDALRRAEAVDDDVLAFQVRIRLTNAYRYGGEPAKAFATFSRTLADHDRDPSRFSELRGLLWQMKGIVNSLTEFPEVPLDRTYAVLDDMERRYKAAGYSLQAVYHYRNLVARHVGDASAEDWYERWRGAERDDLSDCAGCDPSGMVNHLVRYGRHEEAFAVAAPVLDAELTCNEQPQGIQTAMLPVYLRTGRVEEARDAHRRAYRVHRSQLADLSDIAEHVAFCATTGNEARALEIVARHLGWLDRAPSPYAEMRFAAAAALALRRILDAGHTEMTIRRVASGDRPAADVPLADLHTELAGRAGDLAVRFDARNGTSSQGDLVREVLEAEPHVEFLPLGEHHRRGPAEAAEPDVPHDDLASLDGPDALLDEAERARRAGDLARAVAAWERFDAVAAEPTAAQRARRLNGRAMELEAGGDVQAAMDRWREAIELFGEAGEDVRRALALSRLGSARIREGDEAGLDDLVAAADRLAARTEDESGGLESAATLIRLAGGCLDLGRPADAIAALDRVEITAEGATATEARAETALLRGGAHALAGDLDAALPTLRGGIETARELRDSEMLSRLTLAYVRSRAHLARVLASEGQGPTPAGEEEFALLDEALERLPAGTALATPLHTERGLALLEAGRPADAVADLAEAVAGWTSMGAHEQAFRLRVDLAAGYLSAGRHLEAAEVAEEALPALGEPGDERRCRLILAHAQKEMQEAEGAATFLSLAEDAAKEEDHGATAHFLEQSAEILTGLDRDALAAERFARSAASFGEAGDPYGVVRNRRRAAMCLLWSGRSDEAAAAIETAREALPGLPADNEPARIWETALVAYDQARILAQIDRLADAESHASAAADGFTTLGETDAAQTATRLRDDLRSALE